MGILRMIKLFGWEPKIAARLAEKREHELQYIKIRQILNLLNGNIKWVYPSSRIKLSEFIVIHYLAILSPSLWCVLSLA